VKQHRSRAGERSAAINRRYDPYPARGPESTSLDASMDTSGEERVGLLGARPKSHPGPKGARDRPQGDGELCT
jgi:hypothetical protein